MIIMHAELRATGSQSVINYRNCFKS